MDPSNEESFEESMIEIEKLLKECRIMAFKKPEAFIPTPVQIRKFMTYVFIFQLYTLFVDPEFILVRGIDKFLTDLNEDLKTHFDEQIELEIDEVD